MAAKFNEKPAQKIEEKTSETLSGVLILIGKPLYFLLSYIIITFLFVSYLIGHFVRMSFEKIRKVRLRPYFPKLTLPKLKLPEVKTIFAFRLPKIRFIFNIVFLFFVLSSSFLFFFWYTILRELPKPEDLISRDIEVSTKIYDRNGLLLYKIYKDKNRTPVPLEKIPLQVRLSTIAIEDAEFYNHTGFSLRGIVRSLIKNFQKGELTGGSTITQQLVKNALLTPEKTFTRKIKEVVLAVLVESKFTKDEILKMYLNEVSYGGIAYGIQEAAQLYFEKDVDKLTLGEAALLSGLPRCPTKCSPYGASPESSFARQKEVLRLMEVNGFITKEQRETAESEKIKFATNKVDIKAPHFVMYVKEKLVEKYSEEVVESGGLEVVTTLDYQIQKLAEEALKTEVDKLSKLRVGNGAAVVLAPQTGEILAMVGSKDYFDIKNDGNVNIPERLNSPGSSIKVVNYAYALSNGYTPSTIISDTPISFKVPGQPTYTPKNYDGEYRGALTLRNAFAESRNVPAVKVLASYGVSNMIETGRKMGIKSWEDPSNYGLSLTLGGGDITLLELANVYATVANYGKRPEIKSILSVTNYKGKTLEEDRCGKNNSFFTQEEETLSPCEGEQVLDPRVAFQIIDILKDNSARSPSFGSNSMLVIPKHSEIAVKTGTSNDLRDNLTVGFNQGYLVAVWVGNTDNSPMARVASGVTGAAPIWNKIMRTLLAGKQNHPWDVPGGLVQLPICTYTGTLACEGCPTKMEWFFVENRPKARCSLEQIEKIKKPGQILEPAAHFP